MCVDALTGQHTDSLAANGYPDVLNTPAVIVDRTPIYVVFAFPGTALMQITGRSVETDTATAEVVTACDPVSPMMPTELAIGSASIVRLGIFDDVSRADETPRPYAHRRRSDDIPESNYKDDCE